MTHGFDDNWSKYAEQGRLNEWSFQRNKTEFDRFSNLFVQKFQRFESVPGACINALLTLGENLVDLDGVSIALDVFKHMVRKIKMNSIDGFSSLQGFLKGCPKRG